MLTAAILLYLGASYGLGAWLFFVHDRPRRSSETVASAILLAIAPASVPFAVVGRFVLWAAGKLGLYRSPYAKPLKGEDR